MTVESHGTSGKEKEIKCYWEELYMCLSWAGKGKEIFFLNNVSNIAITMHNVYSETTIFVCFMNIL